MLCDAYYVIPRGSSIPEVVKSSGDGRTGNENQQGFRWEADRTATYCLSDT